MKQIRDRYSINRIDELSAQDAVQCLACLRSYDEKKSKEGVGDYVAFRSSCGDQFVHQWKRKIYWKR